jgi:DNA-binding transcriptional MerR regulator
MRIGELAKRTGVSLRMLRYYEQDGLLTPARSSSGQRFYTRHDVETVRRILLLKRAGLTLPVIRALIDCLPSQGSPRSPCDALKVKVSEQMARIDHQVAALHESRQLLSTLVTEAE